MKKGFTLIELLAVIVILAIILAIAVPSISGIISSATRNAFEDDAKMVIITLNYKLLEDSSFDLASVNESNIGEKLNVSGENYDTVKVTTLRGKPYVVIEGQNKWDNLTAYGSYDDMAVTESTNYTTVVKQIGYDERKGANEPKLITGMTPIKWDGTTWVDTTVDDPNWYSYDITNKQWANARTADGSMWVWIPRYIYKISSGWHSSTTGTIDVQFSMGVDDTLGGTVTLDTGATSNASNNKWTNQPSFSFGSTEVTGIWVGKFEATAVEGVANGFTSDASCLVTGDDVTTKTIKVIPNAESWRCISIGNMFTNSRSMETNAIYGWGTSGTGIDVHLMKNTEWGAIAYFSKSSYGQGTNEIWVNNSQTYTTGCAGTSASPSGYNGCQNTYDTTNGINTSTTGNIYGIYDIAGGSWEFAAAYVNNGNSNLSQGSSIIGAGPQYGNVYAVASTDSQVNNYPLTINQRGDAIYETSSNINGAYSWFGDDSIMPNVTRPWFIRGGRFDSGSIAGPFAFTTSYGGFSSYISFRPVFFVNEGL